MREHVRERVRVRVFVSSVTEGVSSRAGCGASHLGLMSAHSPSASDPPPCRALALRSRSDHRYQTLVGKILKGQLPPRDVFQIRLARPIENDADDAADEVRLPINQQALRKAWEASQRSTKDDWLEWINKFSVELVKERCVFFISYCVCGCLRVPQAGTLEDVNYFNPPPSLFFLYPSLSPTGQPVAVAASLLGAGADLPPAGAAALQRVLHELLDGAGGPTGGGPCARSRDGAVLAQHPRRGPPGPP